MGIMQTPWTSQPQQAVGIDWGNPITRGLRAVVSGVADYDYVTGRTLSKAEVNKVITPHGVANKPTVGSLTTARYVDLPFEISGAVTVHAIVSRDASVNDADSSRVCQLVSNRVSGTTGWEFNLGNGFGASGDDNKPRFSNNTVGIGSIWVDGVLTSGNNPSATALSNGVFYQLTAVASSGATASSSGKTRLFGSGSSASENYAINGRIPLIMLWDRALSDFEVRRVNQNPWQIFKPIPRRIFVPVATGGSDVTITGNIGDATASGLTASVSQAASISAGVGNAVAAGSQSSVAQQYTLSAGIGNATAAGITATITASGLTTISCTTGNAVAAGSQAVVNSAATVTCSVGNASAAGLTAALDTAYTILANVGNATADGLSATIQAATGISCGVANAIAAGLTASVTNNAPLTDSEKIDLILDILSNRQTLDPSTGVYTLYADDGVTVLKTAQAWEDAAGTIPYRGRALQRLDAME